MKEIIGKTISEKEQEEIREFLSLLLVLSREDKAILLANANAFRARLEIEKMKNAREDE